MNHSVAGVWHPLADSAWQPSGNLKLRYMLNRRYMISLETDRLLLNHEVLAGIVHRMDADARDYGGWESANCQLRGHFAGHYLSACAMAFAYHGDAVLRARGEEMVERLYLCQQEHGDGWCFSIPQTYLHWLERAKPVWAPQYTVHKTIMGLLDMAVLAGSRRALEILDGIAGWFWRWVDTKSRAEMDNILDVETGGMLEAWADLYAVTGDARCLRLIEQYRRPRIFEELLKGRDVLTLMHANTTLVEALGYARVYEVLGHARDLEVVKAYWDSAIATRGAFATGGQTCNEVWTPPHCQSAFLGRDNQEHCVMYNLIRLADFLWRHTGRTEYLEYIGRAYTNGILAQQHEDTGMVAYYLPMHTGASVQWGSERGHFWCCHGTLVQIHQCEGRYMAYHRNGEVLIAQYHEADIGLDDGGRITLRQNKTESHYAPFAYNAGCSFGKTVGQEYTLELSLSQSRRFTLSLRIPAWISGHAEIILGNETLSATRGTVLSLDRIWKEHSLIRLRFPRRPTVEALPDQPQRGALMLGEDVLVGLTSDDCLQLTQEQACDRLEMITPDAMRCEQPRYRLYDGHRSIVFIPLQNLRGETYTMYFAFQD